jgi:phage terminase large subunit-like protein
VSSLEQLQSALGAAHRLATACEVRPLEHIRWTPPQHDFLRDLSRFKILTAGQQVGGKTTAGLADVVGRCTGDHPHIAPADRISPPIRVWIVSYSSSQQLQIMDKLWDLLPKDKLTEDTRYKGKGKGFYGQFPVVGFTNGSIIEFRTWKAGASACASGTVHHILVDEPCSEDVLVELMGRLRRTGGTLAMTLTPWGQPCMHIEQRVTDGQLHHIQARMTVANLTPIGATGPLRTEAGEEMDQAWIDDQRAATPTAIAGIVLDGDWETRHVGAYFDQFDVGAHVSKAGPRGETLVHLGIDHGHRPGKQIALLCSVVELGVGHVRVWVIDEYVDDSGVALPEDDARGILKMLAAHGMRWPHLDEVWGDRVHMRGTGRQKSNKDLQAQIGKVLRVPPRGLRPQIKTAKREGRASVDVGARWLYHATVRPGGLSIHPRCERLIAAFEAWNGSHADSDDKDPIDALRYALEPVIWGGRRPGKLPVLRVGGLGAVAR